MTGLDDERHFLDNDDRLTNDNPLEKPPEGLDEILRNEPETPEEAEAEPRDWPEHAREIIDDRHADSARQFQDENTGTGQPEGAGTMNSGNADEDEGGERWREIKS